MDQRQELLSLLCGLRDHSGTENQALREVALSRVNQIQVEKESLRKQIDELEPVPEGELSYHTTDVEVKQVVAQIMQMYRESNEHLLREMDTLKAEADSQSQARTNIRRVRDAYTKRLSPVNWEAYS